MSLPDISYIHQEMCHTRITSLVLPYIRIIHQEMCHTCITSVVLPYISHIHQEMCHTCITSVVLPYISFIHQEMCHTCITMCSILCNTILAIKSTIFTGPIYIAKQFLSKCQCQSLVGSQQKGPVQSVMSSCTSKV